MNFSTDSEAIMTFLMKDFKKFSKKKTAMEQQRFDNMLLAFYKKIQEADKKTKRAWDTKEIKREIREIMNPDKLKHDELLNSIFVPESIKRFIRGNTIGIITYRCTVLGKNITLIIHLMNNKQFNELAKIDKMVRHMFVWLYFIIPYTTKTCSKNLKIICYLTPHKKYLPRTQFNVLGPNNVNGGVSGACPVNGKICIYRKEELFKVFIHETFHAFGLDWSNIHSHDLREKMRALFPISSNMELSETYTEFWANIFNCLFTAYYLRDNNDRESFLLYAEYCIYFEQMFSLFQCVKILQFMGIYYKTLYDTDDLSIKARKFLYKERSNVFAYYILKTVLLIHATQFMTWCVEHNSNILNFTKTNGNLTAFYDFVKAHYNSPRLLDSIDKMHPIMKSSKKYDSNVVSKTLRMTVIEMA